MVKFYELIKEKECNFYTLVTLFLFLFTMTNMIITIIIINIGTDKNIVPIPPKIANPSSSTIVAISGFCGLYFTIMDYKLKI